MKETYIDSREDMIITYIKDKDILDLWAWDIRDRFLHKFLVDNAKSVVWIELMKYKVENMKKHWYNLVEWNAETLDLWKKYDVVIAWDLIEHVDNAWLFLENVKRHLKKDGVFIFNTPNAYAINFLVKWLLSWGTVHQFYEHVTLFNEELIINLLNRFGIKIEKTIYFTHKENNFKSYILRLFWKISKKWNENMLFICKI